MKWVKYERDGAIVTITMNRPERLNAWGVDTSRDLGEAFEQYDNDDEARVAILCGAGRSFCAGGDAKDYRERQAPWSKSPQDEIGIFGRGPEIRRLRRCRGDQARPPRHGVARHRRRPARAHRSGFHPEQIPRPASRGVH